MAWRLISEVKFVERPFLWLGAALSMLGGGGGLLAEVVNGNAIQGAASEPSLWVGLAGLVVAVTGLVRVFRSPDAAIAKAKLDQTTEHHMEILKLINDENADLRREVVRLRRENARLARSQRTEEGDD